MNEKTRGIVLIILSSLLFALMVVAVKYASDHTLYEKLFFRAIVGLIAISIILWKRKISIKAHSPWLMFFRCFFGFAGTVLYFNSLKYLGMGISVTINKTSPFFVMIFAYLFLHEKLNKYKIISLLIAILGVVIIMKPSGDFNIWAALGGLLGAMGAGAAYTIIRELKKSDKPLVIIFYFFLYSLIVTLPMIIKNGIQIHSNSDFIWLVMIGVFAVTAQICMTYAYHHAPASELAIYSYMNVVFSTILGVILFKEFVPLSGLIGIALILVAGYINFIGNKSKMIN